MCALCVQVILTFKVHHKLIEKYQISHHSSNFCINAIEMFNTGNWLGFVDLLVNMEIQLTLEG